MQQQGARRDTIMPSRWRSGARAATSNLHEIPDTAVDETNPSERGVRFTTAAPSELSSTSLPQASSGKLRELGAQVLRIAIHQACTGRSVDGSTEKLSETLQEICATARANDLRVEALILDLKSTWWQLSEAHGTTRRDAEIALAEVITLCIKEYYAPGSASTRRGGAARTPVGRGDLHLT